MGSRWREVPLRVYFTDASERALLHARSGRYPVKAVRGRTARFFFRDSGGWRIRPFVRSACRFSLHDLAEPAPFSRLDLILWPETLGTRPLFERARILSRFRRLLSPHGYLFDRAGKAAELPGFFEPVSKTRGLYAPLRAAYA